MARVATGFEFFQRRFRASPRGHTAFGRSSREASDSRDVLTRAAGRGA